MRKNGVRHDNVTEAKNNRTYSARGAECLNAEYGEAGHDGMAAAVVRRWQVLKQCAVPRAARQSYPRKA